MFIQSRSATAAFACLILALTAAASPVLAQTWYCVPMEACV